MRVLTAIVSTLALAATLPAAQRDASKTLDIYVIDVEGGNAQLWVTPSGQSLVYDTGNGGAAAVRDADRIMAAVKDAGVTQIDYVVTTHFHGDHVGGLPELATRIPIKEFVDHGPNVQPGPQIDRVLEQYGTIYAKAKHTIVKSGDRIPVKGLEWRIVNSAAQVLKAPLPGAGAPNPHCASFRRHEVNPVSGGPLGKTEDEQSVGSHVTFGRFRVLYLGDFDWNQEFDLMCPVNRIGTVDLFIPSRHGQFSSNSETLVHPLRARVMIMNNGLRKGGQPEAMKVFLNSPGLEDLWQIHFAFLGGQEHNVPGMYIANLDETTVPVAPMVPVQPGTPAANAPQHNGPAHWIKVSVRADGNFTITNSRNGLVKTYRNGS
ncbi:MAG TPA: MBL fold metallo-hydrolase [Vicinamibacterales bacterium]|nr:MBL fold metallo-hydrolase [Vicinamibacterales bacterium]